MIIRMKTICGSFTLLMVILQSCITDAHSGKDVKAEALITQKQIKKIDTPSVNQTDSGIQITKRYIDYNNPERIKLSLDYLAKRHGIEKPTPTIEPRMIILHFTAGGTLNSIYNYFNNVKIEDARTFNSKQSSLNVSSQFVIGRKGEIIQLMPDTFFARHAIGLNYCAIGIENIGSEEEPLTDAQVMANAALVRHLKKQYPDITYLIGHAEYGIFRKSSLWKETDPTYFTGKSDPGDAFMKKVRLKLKDLNLQSAPSK